MQSSAEFRTYQVSDLDEVLNLCVQEGWDSYTADRSRAHQVFTAPGVVSVVATIDNEAVGFAYCQSDGAIQAHLSLLVVDHKYRRSGIARALVAYLFSLLGPVRVDLITENAGDFYRSLPNKEKLGFRLFAGTE
jgi:ribosomal protein S18 acetylase RimI-like enzyme